MAHPMIASRREAGYASLAFGVILLLVLSLMSIYLARSGIVDLRTSANKARYAEALAQAERRLEVGLGWMTLSSNRATLDPTNDGLWPLCSTLAAPFSTFGNTWRCRAMSSTYTGPSGSQTDAFTLATPNDANVRGTIYYVATTGTSGDNTANATVKQGIYFYSILGDGTSQTPPMMGAGNVPLNGTFSVVANPNGAGPGVPVSVWSRVSISAPQGSSATCQIQEFTKDGDCSGSPISQKDIKGPDIVDNDPNFPTDVFQYVFGLPTSSYGTIKAQSPPLSDCSSLAGRTGIVWVTGNCTISGTVGNNGGLILVVEGGNIQLNANSRFRGLLFAFGPNGNAGDITANGGAQLYGSMISNDAVSMGININGTFDMIYDTNLIGEITSPGNTQFKPMARIPASWADYF